MKIDNLRVSQNINGSEQSINIVKWIISIFLVLSWIALIAASWRVMVFVRGLKQLELLEIKMLAISFLALIGIVYIFTVIAFLLLLTITIQHKKELKKKIESMNSKHSQHI